MSCYLILGLPRSGTSITNDLLAEQYGLWNLGEHWRIREKDFDIRNFVNRSDELKSRIDMFNLSLQWHKERVNRLSYLVNNTNKKWVVKMWASQCLSHKDIVQQMCSNDNIKILLVQRRNTSEHLTSIINAVYRNRVLKYNRDFVYTNKTLAKQPLYDKIDYKPDILSNMTMSYCDMIADWRLVYELYKPKVTIVSYERHIKNIDLKFLGVSDQCVDNYNKREEHLIPTPFNSDVFTYQDTYNDCLNMLSQYDYMMDV